MKRTINYTGRKRLTNNNYNIQINRNENHIESFDASFNFQELSLHPDTKLYVEAYHLSDYARYDFGTISNITNINGTDLTRLGYQDNIKFRILAVDESGKIGRIVASANGINPEKPGGEAKEETLLQVEFKDIGQQIWLLRYCDDGEPIMVINDKLRGIAKTDIRFFVYIYPAVLREILIHLIFITKIEATNDLEGWQKDWLNFSNKISGVTHPESLNPKDQNFEENTILDWIDQVVEGFCNSHKKEWAKFIAVLEDE
jgi:hypothetical protein